MTLIQDSQKGDSWNVRTYCMRDSSCVGSDIGTGSWSMSTYRMSMHATTNSCVDRLKTEGDRDPASRLTQTADKRRERATLAETNEQKQERLRDVCNRVHYISDKAL